MRKTMFAAALLGFLTLAAGCSGVDDVLGPQKSPSGGSPPSTVEGGSQNLGEDPGSGQLGAK